MDSHKINKKNPYDFSNVKKRISNDLMEATKNSLRNVLLETYIRENIALSECQASWVVWIEFGYTFQGVEWRK